MKHLNAINRKAQRVEAVTAPSVQTPTDGGAPAHDVVALQQGGGGQPPQQPEGPHIPPGCSIVFSPGWEADRTGGTAGLCQPVERDLFDCHWAVSGRRCPTSSITRPTGRPRRRRPEGLAQDRPGVPRVGRDMNLRESGGGRRRRAALVACAAVAVAARRRCRRRASRPPSAPATASCTSAPTAATSASTTRPPKLEERIVLKNGIARSLPSQDRSRFYVLDSTYEKLEVVDIATRRSTATYSLSSGNRHVRVISMQADPLNRFLVLLTRTATKQIDRWEIGPATLQQFDLASGQISRTIPWPRGEERESVNPRFSPDGKLLYFFGDVVVVVATETFTEVDTWPLSQPAEPGMGRINLGPVHDFYDAPGTFTGLFTTGSVQHRHHGHRHR